MTKTKSLKRRELRQNVKTTAPRKRKVGGDDMQLRIMQTENDDMRPGAAPPSYRLALKALRNRSQLTLADCAKAVDLSTTGYQRYENDKNFDSTPIPYRVIRGLVSVMAGLGNPPIEEHELINISELRDAPRQTGQTPEQTTSSWDASDFAPVDVPKLPIRYVVERGVYRTVGLSPPHYGSTPISPANSWDQGKQWAARVIGPDGANFRFPSGSLLHCLDIDAVPPSSVLANAVVVAERTRENLSETLLARVIEMTTRREGRLRDSDGQEFVGTVRGLVMFQYSPVTN